MGYAILESLLIHGRCLIYFFCHEKKEQKKKKPKEENISSDWNITDLKLTIEPENITLKTWREEVNARVAHLTSIRADAIREWDVINVRTELQSRIDKLKDDLKKKAIDIPSDWLGDQSTESKLLPYATNHYTPPQGHSVGATGSSGPK